MIYVLFTLLTNRQLLSRFTLTYTCSHNCPHRLFCFALHQNVSCEEGWNRILVVSLTHDKELMVKGDINMSVANLDANDQLKEVFKAALK